MDRKALVGMVALSSAPLVLGLAHCGGSANPAMDAAIPDASSPGATRDAGIPRGDGGADAGGSVPDAGHPPDAGGAPDGGSDAGVDAGSDAGSVPTIGEAPDGGSAAEVLASDDAPDNLAMDATHLYWVDRNPYSYCTSYVPCDLSIRSMAKTGGDVATLATVSGHSFFLAVDDASVYFGGVVGNQVCGRPSCPQVWKLFRVPKSGGTPAQLASGLGTPDQLSLNATEVFLAGVLDGQSWSTYGILDVRKDASVASAVLAPGEHTSDVLASGARLYWPASDGIRSLPDQGGSATQLFSQPSLFPSRMAADPQNVYFLAQSSLWAAPLAGGMPRLLIEGSSSEPVSSVDAYGGEVYWTQGGCLGRVEPDGSLPQCLDQGDAPVRSVRVDNGSVYAVRGNDVIRLPH